jgi:hypothetical protein
MSASLFNGVVSAARERGVKEVMCDFDASNGDGIDAAASAMSSKLQILFPIMATSVLEKAATLD